MKERSIILTVTNDLVTDQRVHRSCMALSEAGYKVTLVGRELPESVPLSRPYLTRRMRLIFRRKAFFYAEYNIRLYFLLLFSKADAFYANDTDSLPAVYAAARLRRKPIFFDAHEMFPEVPELVGRDRVKHFWSAIEDYFFPRLARYPHGAAACTVCRSIAEIYDNRYALKMSVVRNVPLPHDTILDEKDLRLVDIEGNPIQLPSDKHILLYQGAVNVGRGIEWIIEAMRFLDDSLFLVAGTGDILDQVRRQALASGVGDRVLFLGRLPLEQLHLVTRCAHLGMSLLENRGLNYYYSFPNRLADFIQAGVPVLATDFPEISRVVSHYGVGTLVPDGLTSPEILAHTIRDALAYWASVNQEEKQLIFSRAAKDLSWENDKNVLLEAVNTIFL